MQITKVANSYLARAAALRKERKRRRNQSPPNPVPAPRLWKVGGRWIFGGINVNAITPNMAIYRHWKAAFPDVDPADVGPNWKP